MHLRIPCLKCMYLYHDVSPCICVCMLYVFLYVCVYMCIYCMYLVHILRLAILVEEDTCNIAQIQQPKQNMHTKT
jgi:hypothetical protein